MLVVCMPIKAKRRVNLSRSYLEIYQEPGCLCRNTHLLTPNGNNFMAVCKYLRCASMNSGSATGKWRVLHRGMSCGVVERWVGFRFLNCLE